MYDIFLSHSSSDKEWVRELAQRVNTEQFQGRYLRAWFDEKHLEVGDHLRPEIEAALKMSRHLGVVLTRESVQSKWVTFEWNHFHELNRPGSVIIPMLLEKCEIPILFTDLIRIDFTDENKFEAGFSRLMQRLCKSDAPTLNQAKEMATELLSKATRVYEGRFVNEPTAESDALYEYLASLNIENPGTEGLVFGVFEVILEYLETLSDERAYNPTMLVAECLAALLTRSVHYDRVIQNWQTRDHWTWKMVAIRAYSKLAEIDPDMVDVSGLLYCAADLDRKAMLSTQEQVLMVHMIRTAGKMKDTTKGEDLIELLAGRKSVSRQIAAGSISIDPADAGPVYLLSFLSNLEKRPVAKKAPHVRLLKILSGLLADNNSSVRQTAADTAHYLKQTYPDLQLPVHPSQPDTEANRLEIKTRDGRHLPFSGRIYKVTEKNQLSVSESLRRGTIYCLTEDDLADVCFYGASGLLILDQAPFSHQCMRLMNASVPYAMVSKADMAELPNGLYAVVDEDGMLRIR